MASMTVKGHMLYEYHVDANEQARFGNLTYDEIQADPDFSHKLISFVCNEYNPVDGRLYLGATAFDNDIFFWFDIDKKEYHSLNFKEVAERFDIKIHRSLCIDDDGVVYGATAGLHGYDQQLEGKGGKVFRYDPRKGKIEILGIPVPHQYIQTIALDKQRKILYGFTYPVQHGFRFDIATGKSKDFGCVANGPHTPVIDDQGNMWATWLQIYGFGITTFGLNSPQRCCFMQYHPDTDKSTFHKKLHLPLMFPGDTGGWDSSVNGADGYIYLGSGAGGLFRFDPRILEIKYLGRPTASMRIAGLCVGKDGRIWGSAGSVGDTHLFAYDREPGHITDYGPIWDPELRTSCFYTHWICEPRKGEFYVAETDNMERAAYLWECNVNP